MPVSKPTLSDDWQASCEGSPSITFALAVSFPSPPFFASIACACPREQSVGATSGGLDLVLLSPAFHQTFHSSLALDSLIVRTSLPPSEYVNFDSD